MKFEYLIDEQPQIVEENNIEDFITKNPQAKFVKEIDEPGNTDPLPEKKDAPVEENNMASNLEVGSSDLQEDPVPKNLYGDFAEPYLQVLQNVEGPTTLTPPFTKSTLDLFNNNSSTSDIDKFFKNEFIPSKFTYNAILKDIEDLNPNNPTKFIESYSDDLKKFKSLDTDSQNKIVQDFYNILTKDTNPVGKIFNNEIQKSYNEAIELTKTQIANDKDKIENEWLNTEQGKRQKQLADTYGVNFEEFTGEEINAANIFNEYFGLRSTQEKFFNDKIKEIELDKKSEKLLNDNFNKIVEENDALKSIDKRIVQSSLNFIDEFGNVLNREELGLDLKYGPLSVGYELIKKQEAQVGSGFLQKFKIEPTKKRIDNIKNELEGFEGKSGSDMVAFRYNNKAYRTTRNKAEKFLYKEQEKETLELLRALEADEELTRLTETYANNPRFLNEVDFNQPVGNVIGDIIKGSPQAVVDVTTQVALTLGFGMVIQEAGFSFKDQLASTIKKNEKQINDYLNANNLKDTQVNKQKAAINLGLMSENSELISNIVGGINGFLEFLPFKKLFKVAMPNSLTKKIGKQIVDKSKDFLSLGKDLAEIPAIEFLTEIGQGVVTDIGTAAADKTQYMPTKEDLTSYLQEGTRGAQAVLIPAGGAAFSRINRQSLLEKDFQNNKEKKDYIQNLKDNNKKEFDGGFITKELYEQNNAEIDAFEKIDKKLDPKLKGASRIEAASLLYRKGKLEEVKQEKDSTQQESVNQELENIDERLTNIVKEEFSIVPEPTATISTKNQQIAQKNKDLMAIIKDENSTPVALLRAQNELVQNNLGLINQLVNANFDPTKDTTLTREDLLSEVNLAFADLIKTYKIESGVPFGAYIKENLPKRVPAFFEKLVETRVTEEGKREIIGKQDITEIQIEDTVEQAEIDQPTITKLKTELNLDDAIVNKVVGAVKKVFGTSLPAVTDKNFKKKVIEGFTNELTDLVKRDGIFGKDSVEFANFLKDNAEAIYNSLPLEVMTKRFKPFVEKIIDPKTGKALRERTAEGKNIFKKKEFNEVKNDFVNYFIGNELGSSTRSDRKTSIAKQIADQLARDEVVDVLLDPEVSEKFKQIQEIEGKEVPDNFIERAIRELDRGLEFLNKLQQNNTLRFSLIGPELAIAAAKLVITTIKASLRAGDGLANAIGLAIKAVQEKFGNAEINPEIEKIIRKNVSRKKEGIEIKEEEIQAGFEDVFTGNMPTLMKLVDADGKKIKLTDLFKSKDEVNKSINILENFVEKNKDRTDINIPELFYLLGQQTFGARTLYKGRYTLFNRKTGYFKWFNKTFPNFKIPKKKKYDTFKEVDKKFNFVEDKIRAADAMLFYNELAQFVIKNADKNQIAMILSTTAENKNSILKLAAPVLYYQDNLKKNTKTTPEHLSPASFINAMMINKYYYKKDIDIDKILSDYAIAIVDEKLAAALNSTEIGLKTNQSAEYEYGKKHPLKRIFNEKIKGLNKFDTITIKNLETNKIFGFNENIDKQERTELSNEFNQILEETKGVDKDEIFSEAQGRNMGRRANKFKIFVPYSAEDLLGLLYRFAGKGKQGDRHLQWIKDNITTPLTESYIRFEANQQASSNYLQEAKELLEKAGIDLSKEVFKGYTNDQIIRIHLWSTTGYNLEEAIGMRDEQVTEINKYFRQNFDQLEFVDALKQVYFNNESKYPPPTKEWISGTLTTDLLSFTNTVTRAEAFKPFFDNIEAIFGSFDKNRGKLSGENLNKVKAIYGTDFIKALESSLFRIGTGKNRSYQLDAQGNTILNWMNNSIGTIMFFNTRSALLQTISNVNFTNWTDNNPFMLAKAWKNQPQFWKDFAFIFNSDYLKSRRSGLKTDINEQEIADAAAKSDRKVAAVIATILKKGFLPTQYADSFAIALGGASFYRNRINSYKKNGLSQQKAETEAFKDFREISEETQQSSRPDKISMEQAGFAGRLILAFQNTPMQYNRLAKKAGLDLINGRGDVKTNISKIIYYLGVQNAIFYAAQQALFSIYFDDDEEEKSRTDKERYFNVANGMVDSVLRGSGVYGALISTLKNATIETIEQTKKKNPQFINTIKELSGISPPLNSKFRKLLSIDRRFRYKQELEKIRTMGIDTKNPAILSGADALSVGFNLPADRVLRKINNLRTALEEETQLWQSIALAMGYSTYDVGINEFKNSSETPQTTGLKKKKIKKKTIKKK